MVARGNKEMERNDPHFSFKITYPEIARNPEYIPQNGVILCVEIGRLMMWSFQIFPRKWY